MKTRYAYIVAILNFWVALMGALLFGVFIGLSASTIGIIPPYDTLSYFFWGGCGLFVYTALFDIFFPYITKNRIEINEVKK